MAENGLLDIDTLTIDSASISKSWHYGSIRMIDKGTMKTYKTGKVLTGEIHKIYSEIYDYFEEDLKGTYPTYEDFMKCKEVDKEVKIEKLNFIEQFGILFGDKENDLARIESGNIKTFIKWLSFNPENLETCGLLTKYFKCLPTIKKEVASQ